MRRQHTLFLAFSLAAVVSAALVWLLFPHQQQLGSVWALFARLVPFLLATEAIARIDVELVERLHLRLVTLAATFLVFLCYFAPRIFFLSSSGTFPQLYYLVITMLPYTVLALVLCYRLGGGLAGTCRRLSYGLLLLMLSGLEDLAFLTINPHTDARFATIPDRWTWASHINVFFGRPVTKYEAFAFIAAHVVLALLVLFLPARVLGPLKGRLGRRSHRTAPATP
ncbi:MAG: hypothetical protein ABR521_08950 [Gaiellaceae bacterium]